MIFKPKGVEEWVVLSVKFLRYPDGGYPSLTPATMAKPTANTEKEEEVQLFEDFIAQDLLDIQDEIVNVPFPSLLSRSHTIHCCKYVHNLCYLEE